ncbi:Cupredoxin [Artemisia annua]|uniref:Cupredoxin n=1 Tax=Artemisia annua TaxID=35608 RepID=A0A2U1NBM6_ARTAN|nr:Cupredoxin [Artemisia annua]
MAPAIHLTLLTLVITTVTVAAYTNHTVGDKAGWLFDPNTNKSSADYTKWAANKTFELGDYLIFKSNTNQTVVLTYNETTFKSCSVDNSSDSDTFIYNKGSNEFNQPLTVEVPLTIQGPNYFFSSASDGIQCQNGMAFGINVTHGVGLPEYLNQPPPPPYVEAPESNDGDVTPPGAGLGGAGANVRWTVGCAVTCFGIFGVFSQNIQTDVYHTNPLCTGSHKTSLMGGLILTKVWFLKRTTQVQIEFASFVTAVKKLYGENEVC